MFATRQARYINKRRTRAIGGRQSPSARWCRRRAAHGLAGARRLHNRAGGLKRTLEKSAAMVVLRKQSLRIGTRMCLAQSGSAISLILFGDQAEHATYPYCDRGLLAAI